MGGGGRVFNTPEKGLFHTASRVAVAMAARSETWEIAHPTGQMICNCINAVFIQETDPTGPEPNRRTEQNIVS